MLEQPLHLETIYDALKFLGFGTTVSTSGLKMATLHTDVLN